MNESISWVLEGVEPEAQEAAKLAAKRAGIPLGTWISQTLMTAAAVELKRGGGAAAQPPFTTNATSGGHQPPALTTEMLLDNIRRLSQRIETAEQRTSEAITPLSEKMAHLSERVEEVSTRASISTAPMERAMARMAERLEQLENKGRPSRLSDAPPAPRRRFRLL
jgi:methyl-accepting chemotaxis protein